MKLKAEKNLLMQHMNVNLSNLRGRNHPALSNVVSSKEGKKVRPYIKFLTGDYLTYERKQEESWQGNPIYAESVHQKMSQFLIFCPSALHTI